MKASNITSQKINRIKSRTFRTSTSWTPDFSGIAIVYCGGAGGSGAASGKGYTSTGGGAGGIAIKKINITAGTPYTITIGAGGDDVTGSASIAIDGIDGTPTTFTGDGHTLTANGGGGGKTGINYASTALVPGGAGGTASGGDQNYTGGRGGDFVYGSNNTGSQASASGGGGGGLYGDTPHGGDITGYSNATTGGASFTTSAMDFSTYRGPGAGTGGIGDAIISSPGPDSGSYWFNSIVDYSAQSALYNSVVTDNKLAFNAPFAGSGALWSSVLSTTPFAGPLCGGGGGTGGSTGSVTYYASSATINGGGGGGSKLAGSGGTMHSGTGGDGFVHIEVQLIKD